MIPGEQITALFKQYGFSKGYSSNDDTHTVYTIRSGYFHQAEILALDPSDSVGIQRTRHELERTGYACTTRNFVDFNELKQRLFRGFFAVDETKQRQRHHYEAFRQRVARAIGGNYEYISGPYVSNDIAGDSSGLIQSILQELEPSEPTLILIEATAGFGKTCTAYELLAALSERYPDNPPLFIELARNRQAPIFRYVLLDEIDRNYPSLNSDLVTLEISNGTVPLIVDGFDELLRHSIDKQSDAVDGHLETMLDTIADLLRDRAKVVLTTRRTAMFSAAAF